MNKESYFIVGDKFKAFANYPKIITLSEAKNIKQSSDIYQIAQGISQNDANKLIKQSRIEILTNPLFTQRANLNILHKVNDSDILITSPKIEDKTHFSSDLLIDDKATEMQDHASHQVHLQGKLLVEAACQMSVAVACMNFIENKSMQNHSFILEKIEANFTKFDFPLETNIKLIILSKRIIPKMGVKFSMETQFFQAETLATEIIVQGAIYNEKFINAIEPKALKEILDY